MNAPLIEMRGVSYCTPTNRHVLDDLDFSIFDGEKIALTGSNGAGKSTLLHIMVGLLKADTGVISAFGKDRVREADFHEVRCRAGLCFQVAEHQLFCPTVAEDVGFGPLNLGKSHKETRQITQEVLTKLGLEGYEARITHHLSGGEKRLVALASVLAMSPDVLLLDEPTAGLDDSAEQRLIDVLNQLPQAKLIVSHDDAFLQAVTDKSLRLERGQLT